ncbi:major facilitator superfamily transporter [Periconia macrospinosa]|uniref:Major facilitator superfamily transporter n=1 Tax=Periconia macrospinosa TaxID=97972 RepID=A0A2V1DM81_9PLEO|nr:major facilitator superfamily transporter [Periconia macrospinosa]
MVVDVEKEAATDGGTHQQSRPIIFDDAEIDKMGRIRPEVFRNVWVEIGFCICILTSSIVAEFLISGFNVLLPVVIEDLQIDPSKRTWPANVFALVTGALLLPFGRLADMYGGYVVFLFGLTWMAVWSLIGGFSINFIMLVMCRALQGIGAAAFLPAGIMLLGSVYRPGPRKNVVFSFYGACAPFGFFFGICLAGLSGQYLTWGWFFWIGTILLGVVVVGSVFLVPNDRKSPQDIVMDWWGLGSSFAALILLVYAFTDSAHYGWKSPQILVTLILGIGLFAGFLYIEAKVAIQPLLPLSLFQLKYMKSLVFCLFLSYGSFGIYLFYASFYMETVLHISPLLSAGWFAPLAITGIVIGTLGGFVLHRLTGTVMLAISTIGFLISSLLFALTPDHPSYWAWILPAMICASIGIDITFNISNIFITSNVPADQQGLAGALINVLLFVGMSIWLGIADYAVSTDAHLGLKVSYNVGFYLAVAIAGLALLLVLGRIRIGKAKSDLTVAERDELEQELLRRRNAGVSKPPK